MGDKVLIKQEKTTTKPSRDPNPYKVVEIKETKITAKRGQKERTRNVDKMKILTKRPDYLETKKQDWVTTQVDSEEEDWLGLVSFTCTLL